jgi:flagellar biosynthesis GTPase FlhF
MMRPCKRLSVFIVVALFSMAWAQAGAAGTKTPGKSVSSQSALEKQFHNARESFLKKDFHDAASEIRSAAAFLDKEEAKAAGESKRDLAGSAQDLRRLAETVEKKAVKSEKELDESFARAEYALARQYHTEASESWAKKEASQAGVRLKAAAGHLENALAWAGSRMEEKSSKVVRDAKDVAEKMEKGVGVAEFDVDKSLDAVKKEIDDAAHKIPLLKG